MKSFFEAHIWPNRGRLYRLVYLWVRDRSLAEDMLQNVFEKSYAREEELSRHPNLSGWLVKSLKNEVLMHFRQTKKLEALDGLEELPVEESGAAEVSEAAGKVMRLVKSLPLRQQEIFQLREVEGLSYEEIAGHLEVSMEQVKVNLHRARKSIRERMINQNISK
ncbi:RNA polymerase sigma factor [Algoriphagus halophytocola]|uniref:RNA polymerase sigma factor n=1 Tax=Algoriphagus halophytocola TaxID=2991499 RepID=A0ABY6MC41_9BACT|nr:MULTISPECIES: RNA polymerase sigma factor [unclassified Algoriphagus]UZD21230.1 RNA polymerase sigma factor [Algoriphagus sp. TR-M5]WBL42441.1 RNA polymerase sigma factor [Algoriphagus sp. TR-M9]